MRKLDNSKTKKTNKVKKTSGLQKTGSATKKSGLKTRNELKKQGANKPGKHAEQKKTPSKKTDKLKKGIDNKFWKSIWNIFERSNIPSLARTSTGKMLELNKSAQNLLGYTLEEIPDTKSWISKLYAPAKQKIIEKIINDSFSENVTDQQLEVTITTKDGKRKDLLALFNNIIDEKTSTSIQIVQFWDITDRKKADAQNRQQKYLIDQLLQNVPDKIYFKDLQSRFLAISQSFYNSLDINTTRQIIGKTDFDIFDFEHATEAFNDEQQIIRTGIPIISKVEKEIWYNQEVHWVLTTKMPYRDSSDVIIGTFGISRDITEMIKSRNQLKESEERYRKLIDSSPFAILVHQNGKVVFANNACVKMVHAKSMDEVLSKNLFEFMPAEYVGISKERIKALSEGAESVPTFELQYYCLDGDIIDVDATAIPIMYDGKKSVLVIANDITEKKLAEKKLIETENRFQSMFENHAAVMLLIDSDTGDINNANKAAIKYYGYPRNSFLKMKLFDINVLPEHEIKKLINETRRIEKNYLTLDHKLANGEIRPVEIYVCPILFDGKTFLFSIIHDITERKKTEALLLENEMLLKKAQMIANVGHYILDVKNGNWICSEQLDIIFGINNTYTRNLELWSNLLHSEDRESMTNYFETEILKKHLPFDREYRIVRASDSKVVWVHGLGNLRFDSNGNISEMFGTIQDITDRKNVELDLLKKQFSVDKAKDMIHWINSEGKIIYANDAACNRTGYTKEELTSMYIFDIDPLFPRDNWEKNWIENREKGSYFINTIHQTKQGTRFPVEVSVNIMKLGNTEFHCTYSRDITQRKLAQEELEESEERYKSILQFSPYSLLVQQNNKLIYANSASIELFAAESHESLLGKNILELIHDDFKQILQNKIDESARSLKPSTSIEEKIVRLDGKVIEVEMITVPFTLHGVFSTLFITRFIGDIKDKNEQLRKLSRAVSQSSAGIMIANKNGVIEYVNPKFSEISGYTETESLGQSTRLLKSGIHTNEFYKDLWDTILNGNEWRGEFRNKKKSGELYWESDSISAIKNESGEITHFLAVKEDISERKKIENDILIAKDEAEEANKVKSSLLANMSHEFRTPLNGILGFTQLLRDYVMEDDVLMMIEKIEKSGKRLMNTLNAVLSLTELETEDFIVQENEIDLSLFCNSIKNHFERFALDKDLQMILDIQLSHLVTVSDESLLTKIVSSICDNAIKYTIRGSITIQLTQPIIKDDSEFVVIKIIDTGMGIRKENHELIFKEFRQLSEGIRRDFEGLGLGLTLASRMARLIDAEIYVESEYGKGSIFSILIPLRSKVSAQLKNDLSVINPEILNVTEQPEPSTTKILLVEDNPLNIEVVQRFLSKTGIVKAVRDGKSALKIASEQQFDVVLIDINLGAGIDGTEVLRILRLQDNYKNIPAVALTGYASDTNKREFLAKGFTGYLAKPFEKKTLINLLKELV